MRTESFQKILDRAAAGQYTGWSIGEMCDRIAWLWKYRKIDYNTMEKMTAQMRYIMIYGAYDEHKF